MCHGLSPCARSVAKNGVAAAAGKYLAHACFFVRRRDRSHEFGTFTERKRRNVDCREQVRPRQSREGARDLTLHVRGKVPSDRQILKSIDEISQRFESGRRHPEDIINADARRAVRRCRGDRIADVTHEVSVVGIAHALDHIGR